MIHYNARVLRNVRIRLAVLEARDLAAVCGGSRSKKYDRLLKALTRSTPVSDATVGELAGLLSCESRHLHLDSWDGHQDGGPDILAQIEQLTAEIIVLPDRLRQVMEGVERKEAENELAPPII